MNDYDFEFWFSIGSSDWFIHGNNIKSMCKWLVFIRFSFHLTSCVNEWLGLLDFVSILRE